MSSKLELMRESNRITHEVLENCKKVILNCEEITKKEVETLASFALTRYNVKSAFQGISDFPGIMCISVNDEIIHGLPNEDTIVKGDVVSLDFGVIHEGYYSDAAITFINDKTILNPISKKRKLVRDTKKAIDAAVDNLKLHYPNCKLSNIVHTIEAYAIDEGYGIIMGFGGHGIGKVLHDKSIFIPNSWELGLSDYEFKIGDYFTIEPMFTLGSGEVKISDDKFTIKTRDGSLSSHFEYSIAITKEGVEVLGIEKGEE